MPVAANLKIFSVYLACMCYVLASNMELFDYSQGNSKTSCQSGVLQGVDQSAVKSVIHLDNNVGDYDYAIFEIKEETSTYFKQLRTIGLKNECPRKKTDQSSFFTCEKESDKSFNLTVFVAALKENSGASVRGFLQGTESKSKTVQLPIVYESSDARGLITINGENTSTDNPCYKVIDSKELHLEFNCSSPAKPCVIEIQMESYIYKINGNYAMVKREITKDETVNVTIKYAACSLDRKHNKISCFINSTYSEPSDLKIVFIVLAIIIIAFILCFFIIWYKNLFSQCNRNSWSRSLIGSCANKDDLHESELQSQKPLKLTPSPALLNDHQTNDSFSPQTLETDSVLKLRAV